MHVPLHRYPDSLSTTHVSQILGCSYSQSQRIMLKMDHTDISTGTGKQQSLRVSKEDLARKFGLKPSLYLAKGVAK